MEGLDVIVNGVGQGEVAAALLQHNLNFRALKTYIAEDGRSYMNVLENGKTVPKLVANTALLRKDEWIALDNAVVRAAQLRLKAVSDLISRGLTYSIPNAMGTTVFQGQTMSDLNDAGISLTGLEETTNEKLQFDMTNIPLPIIHKDLKIPIRLLSASRNQGPALDTMEAEIAGRKVAEMAEKLLIGSTTFSNFGGGTIYGYTTYPYRQTATINDWENKATAGEDILDDVIDMIQAANDKLAFGPFQLYITPKMSLNFERDFKDGSDITIRARLSALESISGISSLDYLPDQTALLVPMNGEVVRMLMGLSPQTLQWESKGGMLAHLKVMAIMVPQIRSDFYHRCGIVHASYTAGS